MTAPAQPVRDRPRPVTPQGPPPGGGITIIAQVDAETDRLLSA